MENILKHLPTSRPPLSQKPPAGPVPSDARKVRQELSGKGKAICLILFAIEFLLPECQPVSFGLRHLHGLGIFDTGNIFEARGPADMAQSWYMSCYGSDSENYWRCYVTFDEEGSLAEKSIEWWYD